MSSPKFEWDIKGQAETNGEVLTAMPNDVHSNIPRYIINHKYSHNSPHNSISRKRKFHEDDGYVQKPSHHTARRIQQPSTNRFKRSRTPRISGHPLPLNRLVEVLDHTSLQKLLKTLVDTHPEITKTVEKLCPRPTTASSLELIQEKFDAIFNHLPYKCDVESAYSYLRVKEYLDEFLNYLSDFILNYLPPIELDMVKSLHFLDLVTKMIHNLPNFANNEFQYTKSMAYEQVSNTWLIVLSQNIQHGNSQHGDEITPGEVTNSGDAEASAKLMNVIKDLGLEDKLQNHNELSMGRFSVVLDFVKSEQENFEALNRTLGNNGQGLLSDLITVDYSKFSIAAHTSH